MNTDQNKAIVRRFYELFNQGDLEAILQEVISEQTVVRQTGVPVALDYLGYRQVGEMFRAAFPDGVMSVVEQTAEGDRVATRTMFTGTHLGEMQGIPPTGRRVEVSGVDIDRIADGKIVERFDLYDQFSLLAQLGVIPTNAAP